MSGVRLQAAAVRGHAMSFVCCACMDSRQVEPGAASRGKFIARWALSPIPRKPLASCTHVLDAVVPDPSVNRKETARQGLQAPGIGRLRRSQLTQLRLTTV